MSSDTDIQHELQSADTPVAVVTGTSVDTQEVDESCAVQMEIKKPVNRKLLYGVTAMCIVTVLVLSVAVVAHATQEQDGSLKWTCSIAGQTPTKAVCEGCGCVYDEQDMPRCYYPTSDYGYYTKKVETGGRVYIEWRSTPLHETQIRDLVLEIQHYSNDMFRLKIKDPANNRYEIPYPLENLQIKDLSKPQFKVYTSEIGERFWIYVKRTSNDEILFDTRNSTLVFLDQLLEFTTTLPSDRFYGIGERGAPFRRNMSNVTMPVFAHDNYPSPIGQNINLYSAQPFYMVVENDGQAHGVLLYNSNAMEVYLTPLPSVTFRVLGGVIDLFFFLGPEPLQVTKQLTDLIGKPFMPPYWSIGFHLCRYHYGNLTNTRATFTRNWSKGMPLDVQWQDIDYMEDKLIFTVSEKDYSGLKQFIETDIHGNDLHYVIIVDPAVGLRNGFDVYERGILNDVYIKDSSGGNIVGEVWPKEAVFPDFTKTETGYWWKSEIKAFHSQLPFDGIWLDMNEPASFVHGSINGCKNNTINCPPYKPNTAGDYMYYKTLCMDARQELGIHRDLHNLYGLSETIVTFDALTAVFPEERPFIISRSTFPGSGKQGGHWLGDNVSNYVQLRQSIIGILDFNIFGIPMTGADIGGFAGNIEEELAIRWHQLGAWYPFCRNHNSKDSVDQDPAIFSDDTFQNKKNAIEIRYDLLPMWYTLFYESHKTGAPIFRATFYNFPRDEVLFDKNFDDKFTQFMIGDNILVAPIVEKGSTSTKLYLPTNVNWYKYKSNVFSKQISGLVGVDVPLSELPYFVTGGSVIFMQKSGQNTMMRRSQPYSVTVLLNDENTASGYIYVDDGTNIITWSHPYAIIEVKFNNTILTTKRYVSNNYMPEGTFKEIIVVGVKKVIKKLKVNGDIKIDGFEYNRTQETVIIDNTHVKNVTISYDIELIP